ncbi:MAG: flippase-like domain-containing protein [Candidatus Rokubacteria bacterium]|nr:flippase-like domain-containing protein [Candidatus Rokubacteria bacterium]
MSRSKVLLGVAISAAFVAYLAWSVDLSQLAAELGRTRWGWALVATILAPAGVWARARRWRYFFPPRSEPPGLVPAMMIGYMANNVLPLRAGELVRVYVVARRWGHGFWTALATVIVERVLDGLAVVLILSVLVFLIPVPRVFEWAAAVLLAADLGALGTLTTLALWPAPSRRLVEWMLRRWPPLQRRALRILETFAQGLEGIRTQAHLVPLLLWTVLIWILPALSAWAGLRAANLALPWVAGWTVLAFVSLGVSVPSAPGYVGVFHAAAAWALAIFDVSRSAAVGFAILFHATQVVPVTLIGWVFLLREHMSLGDAARARPAPGESAP